VDAGGSGTGRAVFVFDAFGTLFDTASVVDQLVERFGADAPTIAASWRASQLRYTWLRSLMDAYEPFERVTRDALMYAARSAGLAIDEASADDLAAAYASLPAYPEVPGVLADLQERGATLAILSNGSPAMLRSLVEGASIADRFDALLSVDSVRVYKPHPAVYGLVTDRYGVAADDVRFVSGNPWDCSGARRFGFEVTWIDRASGAFDELGERPSRRGSDLRVLIGVGP
jgi:2-haloacid dehalogenase